MDKDDVTYMYVTYVCHMYIWNITQLLKKKNEILPFVTIRIVLEGIILSKINQAEKDKYHIFSLTCGI